MLHALLLIAPFAAQQTPAPPDCSVTGQSIASRTSALPPEVLRAIPERMADRGEPFRSTDMVGKGEEQWPVTRLICGYATDQGYVVEREHGGRGYHIERIQFRKTAEGYVPD